MLFGMILWPLLILACTGGILASPPAADDDDGTDSDGTPAVDCSKFPFPVGQLVVDIRVGSTWAEIVDWGRIKCQPGEFCGPRLDI